MYTREALLRCHRLSVVLLAAGACVATAYAADGVEAPAPNTLLERIPGARGPVVEDAAAIAAGDFVEDAGDGAAWRNELSVRWAPLDVAPLWAEDAMWAVRGGAYRIGVNREMPAGPISYGEAGETVILPDGTLAWRLRLEAPGAHALRVHFAEFDLPEGARVVMAGKDREYPTAYEGLGLRGTGEFWADFTVGEEVFIEYQAPRADMPKPVILIDEISHVYKDMLAPAPHAPDGVAETGAGTCSLPDPTCHAVPEIPRDAVGLMSWTFGGSFICTGALLNDVDTNTFAAYFYTANHCIGSQGAANTLTVYWFYQRPTCGGAVPNLNTVPRNTGGATFLGGSGSSDYTFLRLRDDASAGQGFAASTTVNPPLGSTVHMVHHPGGSWKRYASGTNNQASPICNSTALSHLWDFSLGHIQGGSSGSPLFNNNWEVIGALTGFCWFGAQPNCATSVGTWNHFGPKMSASSVVQGHLNTTTPDDAFEDNDTLATAAPIQLGVVHNLRLVDFEDYFRIEVCENTTIMASMNFSTGEINAALRLMRDNGQILTADAASDGSGNVSFSATPGVYIIRCLKEGLWGGDYTLQVSAGSSTDANANGVPDECEGGTCTGDLDGTGTVDGADLATLLGAWGTNNPAADLNNSGTVDGADLAILLGAWGAC